MISQDKLINKWGVWLSYFVEKQNKGADYDNNLTKICTIENWADFSYLWKSSDISDPAKFFIDPQTGKFNKYQIDGNMKKVDSINFFKGEIQPKWECPQNEKGGYYNFSLQSNISDETIHGIYQTFVYMCIGNLFEFSDQINGIRIVDTANKKNNFRCRIQVWLNYRCDEEDAQNLKMLKKHADQIGEVLKKSGINNATLKFFNIGTKKYVNAFKKDQTQNDKKQKNGNPNENEVFQTTNNVQKIGKNITNLSNGHK